MSVSSAMNRCSDSAARIRCLWSSLGRDAYISDYSWLPKV